MINQDWSPSTLHHNASKLNRICKWLHSQHSQIHSLLDKKLDEWLLSLRTYLIKENKYFDCRRVKSFRTHKPTTYKQEDDCIYKFKQIYKFIIDFYDETDEYEKDIWDIYKFGFEDKDINATKYRWFNFTELKESWLYQPVKKFIRYKLALLALVTCKHKLNSLKTFYIFLSLNYPNIQPSEINRQVIVDYLGYLPTLNVDRSHHHRLIADLRDFLEICFREKWADITGNKIIYDDDLPKYRRNYSPRYIPETVIQQIINNLDEIKKPVYKRMFLILIECGMRISELCNMNFNCIIQDNKGNFLLQYHQSKMKKDIVIPISLQVAQIIQEQQECVKQQYGDDCNILFPSPRYKLKYKAIGYTAFCDALKELIYNKEIRDINGKLWLFQSHQCRHTVGTSMINNGVPQHIVQRYLGHESPTMTQVYAHVHDQTMRKEIEKYYESKVVNFQGETTELEEAVLSSNDDLEWFKKNVQARALEHGYCARPKVLGDCDISGFDGCYNCPHWRTNKNFLPVLKDTLERTNKVLQKAQSLGWQLQINKNTPLKDNLEKVINALEDDEKQD